MAEKSFDKGDFIKIIDNLVKELSWSTGCFLTLSTNSSSNVMEIFHFLRRRLSSVCVYVARVNQLFANVVSSQTINGWI